jgi:glycerol kinase
LSQIDGLCARLASLAGVPVDRTPETEATARGLAWLITGGKQAWAEAQEFRAFAPAEDRALRARYDRWRVEIERA